MSSILITTWSSEPGAGELNSYNIRGRVWCVFLQTAGLASDECEDVQNGGNFANVPRDTDKSLFHPGMMIRQVFNTFAHTPEPVDFQQKIPKAAAMTSLSTSGSVVSAVVVSDSVLLSA